MDSERGASDDTVAAHEEQYASRSPSRDLESGQGAADQEQFQELETLDELLKKDSDALSPDEIHLREELIEKHRGHLRQGIKRVEYAQFSGPLPPPNVLASYEQVLPGAAERILQLAEREQASRHRESDRTQTYLDNELRSSTITQHIGQVTGTLIALAGLGLGFYAFSIGESGWGVAIVLFEISALTGAFVLGRRYSHREHPDVDDESTGP